MAATAMAYAAYASAAATAVGAVAQHQQNRGQEKQAKVQRRLVLDAAEQEAAELAERNRRITAKQIAQFGAAGVELDGTPGDLIVSDALRGERDVVNAEIEGQNRGNALKFEARQFRRAATNALIVGAVGATSTALGGASRARTVKAQTNASASLAEAAA